jgi:prophage maintenance system killer protein
MTFLSELENIIETLYYTILKRTFPESIPDKTINCVSFGVIVASIKSVLIDGSREGLDVLEIANAIIFSLLKENFFVYENHQTALLIGYIYLKRQVVVIAHYSPDAVTNNSTLDDIRALTATW